LVIIAGAELFTGNNLLVMAWVARRISTKKLAQNFFVIFFANGVGAIGLATLVVWSGHWKMAGGEIEKEIIRIAATKVAIPIAEAFFKGVLCNILVCLAVWLAMAGRNVTDKILAIIFPISAFVAAGFEHSVANLYFIPLGLMLRHQAPPDGASLEHLDWAGFAHNMIPVTLGNLVGGGVMVGLVYYIIYRRERPSNQSVNTELSKVKCGVDLGRS
jgi:formate/nitrite transporter